MGVSVWRDSTETPGLLAWIIIFDTEKSAVRPTRFVSHVRDLKPCEIWAYLDDLVNESLI